MTEATVGAASQLEGDPLLRRYWDKLKAQRTLVDATLLGTTDIAVVYTASDGIATDMVAGQSQGQSHGDATQDSIDRV
jgi:hypothetical protein